MNENILIVTPDIPYPALTGGKKAVLSSIIEKNEEGANVVVLSFNSKNEDFKDSEKFFKDRHISFYSYKPDYATIANGKISFLIEYMSFFFSLKPRFAVKYDEYNLIEKCVDIINTHGISRILLHSVCFGEIFTKLKCRYKKIKTDFFIHNQEYLLLREHGTLTYNLIKKLLYYLESLKMYFYEKNILSKADEIIFASSFDMEIFSSEIKPVEKSMSCWSQKIFFETFFKHSGKGDFILFPGSVDYSPNLHGLQWFCKNLYCKFINKYPELKIIVTGSCSKKSTGLFRKYDRIFFTGIVDEVVITELFSQCICIISPILKGSGVKIKNLEALQNNIPIVMTKFSAQGIIANYDIPSPVDNRVESFYFLLEQIIENNYNNR